MPRSLSATPRPEYLHRAGADLTALHVRWIVGRAALGDDDIDASPSQIHGQRQPHRATADDQDPGPHTTNPALWCSSATLAWSGQTAKLPMLAAEWEELAQPGQFLSPP